MHRCYQLNMNAKVLPCHKLLLDKDVLCLALWSVKDRQSTTVTPGQSFATVVGPPPLISAAQLNVNSFYLKKLTGNIRICQGCRGSLRLADWRIPDPPHVVVARLERRPFRDPSGTLKTPSRASAAHYHARLWCVCAGDPSFTPTSLVIPTDLAVILSLQHHQLLELEFGLRVY